MFGTKSSTPRQAKPQPPADIEPHEDPNANKGGRGRRARPDEAAGKKGPDDNRPQGKGGWGGGETKAPESRAQGNFFAATGAVDGNATPAEKRRTAADMDDADGDDEENNKSENLKRRGRTAHDDDNDEIMLIPDLEDEDRPDNEDELASKVAAAPRNVVRKLKSLRELDNDIKHVISSVGAGGLDLSLLTSCLVPHELVAEEDGEWQFDALLQELTQQLNADMEAHKAKHGTPLPEAQPKAGETMTEGAKGLGTTTGAGLHVRPSRLGALLTEAK